jgi:hypothetical protein
LFVWTVGRSPSVGSLGTRPAAQEEGLVLARPAIHAYDNERFISTRPRVLTVASPTRRALVLEKIYHGNADRLFGQTKTADPKAGGAQ